MRSANRILHIALDLDLLLLNSKYPGVSTRRSAKFLRKLVGPLRGYILHHAVRRDRIRAERWLSGVRELEEIYTEYLQQSQFTGVGVNDYTRLYEAIRTCKPSTVLECGTGVSTTAIAAALKHNAEEHGIAGHLISMEEDPRWFEEAKMLLPDHLNNYVEVILSPKVEREHEGLRGVCYQCIPEGHYDFVFVDGPTEHSPATGKKLFDMDLIFVAERNPFVQGFIDHRLNTIRYLRLALEETHFVFYNPITKLGYVYPKTKGG